VDTSDGHRRPRRAHYAQNPADRDFGPGWIVPIPREWDRRAQYLVIRLYADGPNRIADGWEALWFQPSPGRRSVNTYRDESRDAVIRWAKTKHVPQILVEDEVTREFGVLE
jgi:hypothetical protein